MSPRSSLSSRSGLSPGVEVQRALGPATLQRAERGAQPREPQLVARADEQLERRHLGRVRHRDAKPLGTRENLARQRQQAQACLGGLDLAGGAHEEGRAQGPLEPASTGLNAAGDKCTLVAAARKFSVVAAASKHSSESRSRPASHMGGGDIVRSGRTLKKPSFSFCAPAPRVEAGVGGLTQDSRSVRRGEGPDLQLGFVSIQTASTRRGRTVHRRAAAVGTSAARALTAGALAALSVYRRQTIDARASRR